MRQKTRITWVSDQNGKMIWATPFVADGTVLNVRIPDTHDWDTMREAVLVKLHLTMGHKKR